ncbi:MAG: ATP synthase F1 subunit epsilon [Thermoleophilia bacterium]|nr:ATP synthase F1 subunit epsilon [Thermoleophilia bacterium]
MEERTELKCEIVTPEGLVMDENVAMVIVPGEMGELGILPRHAPIVSRTVVGDVRVKRHDGDDWQFLAVGNGYVKVQFDRLLMLADTAELAEDIDVARAEEAVHRADEWLAKYRGGDGGVDVRRAEQSRKRAMNRLKVGGRV